MNAERLSVMMRFEPSSLASAWWSRGALLCAVLAAALVVTLQLRQNDRLQESVLGVRSLREARLDLSKGFLHLVQAGEPGAPYSREQGLALATQALRRMELDLREADDPAREATFAARVTEFRAYLDDWTLRQEPGVAAELRAAHYALEREADALDAHLRDRLRRIEASNRREFYLVCGLAGGLLAVMCVVVYRVQTRGRRAARQADAAMEALRERERELSLIADNLPGLLAHFDPDLRYRFANEGYRRWFGIDPVSLVGKSVRELAGEEQFERARPFFEQALIGEVVSFENSSDLGDGRQRHALVTLVPDRDEAGAVKGLFALSIDISGRKLAEESLRRLNAELERRVEQRTEELAAKNRELEMFTYSVSHDLKAPLRGIDGYSRLLLEDYADRLDEEGKRFLGSVRQASAHMGQLIDDLLSYSRLERRAPQPARLRPGPVVRGVLQPLQPEIESRGVRVTESLDEEAELLADPQALNMAVRNLVDNALKFTRATERPELAIEGRREGDVYRLSVRDNGIGFDPRFHDRIFEIFQRLHRIEDYPGTGIGLAIVRKAMERMGGRVWAESAPGRGATFFLQIPLFTQ